MSTEQFIKDIRPGQKNINTIFIVLDIGKQAQKTGNHTSFQQHLALHPSRKLERSGDSFHIILNIPHVIQMG